MPPKADCPGFCRLSSSWIILYANFFLNSFAFLLAIISWHAFKQVVPNLKSVFCIFLGATRKSSGLGDEPTGRCGSTASGRGFPRASSLPAAHAVILGLGDCCRCRGTLCKRPSTSAESLGEAARRRAELERVWLRLRGARLGVLRRSDEFGRGSGQPAACR